MPLSSAADLGQSQKPTLLERFSPCEPELSADARDKAFGSYLGEIHAIGDAAEANTPAAAPALSPGRHAGTNPTTDSSEAIGRGHQPPPIPAKRKRKTGLPFSKKIRLSPISSEDSRNDLSPSMRRKPFWGKKFPIWTRRAHADPFPSYQRTCELLYG